MKESFMKMLLTGLLLTATALASNDLAHRPRSFNVPKGKAVFVDFQEATYDITYDLNNKRASVTARMKFDAPEAGYPVFDSVTAPVSIILDGAKTSADETQTPAAETTLRVLNSPVDVGVHTLEVNVPLTTLVDFNADGGVKSAFWTSDLSHRQFLERYMPASFEYDQLKMTFKVRFLGSKTRQVIYTNGTVTEEGPNSYTVTYPEHFNTSSIFFHTVPEGAVDEISYTLKSIDGRDVPVTIYTSKSLFGGSASSLERFKTQATSVFHELEADYGAWPHPVLLIYNAGSGGMEYCGATITEYRALGHEMFHSYFARGVMPANGNSGWLDEALASWRDNGYKSLNNLSGTSMMSSHPYYTRVTDRAAYTFGENFMRLLNGKLQDKGGLRPFMRHMVENNVFSPLFVEEFIKEMEQFYGVSVTEEFKRYTFGASNSFVPLKTEKQFHHMHQKMSVEELKNYL